MYNRYVPQPDGSYRRSRVPDNIVPSPVSQHRPTPREQEINEAADCPPPEPFVAAPVQKSEPVKRRTTCPHNRRTHSASSYGTQRPKQSQPTPRQETRSEHSDNSVGSFLRQLLPKDFDTGDLLVVLLLLLMSGECNEDQNSALLTLVLYLFM